MKKTLPGMRFSICPAAARTAGPVSLAVLIILSAVLFPSCGSRRDKQFKEDMMYTSGVTGQERLSDGEMKKLEDGIRQYRKEVDRTVNAQAEIGIYYRMLALEYIEREMYGPALESLNNALQIYSANPVLFYMAGVCAGYLAKAQADPLLQDTYFKQAEHYYQRAAELRGGYTNALYGLAVLYVFEMNRIFDAEPLLLRILERESSNFDAMFLLARVYAEQGRIESAVDLYDRIAGETKNMQVREQALRIRDRVLRGEF